VYALKNLSLEVYIKDKMKSKLYILLFSLAIFILTAVGLAVVHIGKHLTFWLVLAYIFACPLVFAFAVDFFVRNGRLSVKKVLILTLTIMVIAATVTHSVWTVVTPRWSFSVSTDKSTYSPGENVKITASLENLGFITHSFKSSIRELVVITITRWGYSRQVWFSPFHFEEREFTISPHQSLERTFIWNQTNIHHPEEKIESGTYIISAFIESVTSDMPSWDPIFSAGTRINITTA